MEKAITASIMTKSCNYLLPACISQVSIDHLHSSMIVSSLTKLHADICKMRKDPAQRPLKLVENKFSLFAI